MYGNYIIISFVRVQATSTGCMTVPLLAWTSFFIGSNQVSEMRGKAHQY